MTEAHKEPNYMAIFWWLLILTVLEVATTRLPAPRLIIAVLLVGMALTKASLVALYFMHLKFERRVLTMIAFTPLLLCVFLALMLMPDSKLALGGRMSGAAGTPAGEAAGAGSPDSKEAPAAPGATPGSAAPAAGEHQH